MRSPFSTHSRRLRSSDPWCSAIAPAQSGRAERMAWYHVSVCDLVFVNTMALAASSSAATTCGTIGVPRWPAQGKRSITGGIRASITTSLGSTPRTMRGGRSCLTPSNASAASPRLPIVADSPQVRTEGW